MPTESKPFQRTSRQFHRNSPEPCWGHEWDSHSDFVYPEPRGLNISPKMWDNLYCYQRETQGFAPNLELHRKSKSGQPGTTVPHDKSTIDVGRIANWLTDRVERLRRVVENRVNVENARQSIRALLDYGENWDGEGAKAISESTVERSLNVLIALAEHAEEKLLVLPMPLFNPNEDGSIDLYWETETVSLFMNVPSDTSQNVGFFGKGSDESTSCPGKYAGEFTSSCLRPDIVAWLVQ